MMSGNGKLMTAADQSSGGRDLAVSTRGSLIQSYEEDEAGEEDVGGADLTVFSPSGARCCSATVWAVPGFCLPLQHAVSFPFGLETSNTLPSYSPLPL